ncbi:MAG: CHAT domain-containing protein, partial [Microcoleaceae cyanobacterium]
VFYVLFVPPGFSCVPFVFPVGFLPPDVGEFGVPIDLIESVGLDTSEPPAPVALARIRTRIESSDSEGSIAVGEGPLQLTNRGGLAERVDSSAPVESVNRAVPDKSAESKSPVDSSNAEGPVDAGDESTAEVGETLVPQGLITANDQRAFQTTNVDATLSLLEEGRNAEFSDYLGLKQTGVRDRQTLQSGLEKIEAETQEVYVVVYVAVQDDKLELVLMSSSGEPIRRSVVEATPEKLSSTIHNLYLKITNPREHTTKGYREPAQQLYQWMIQPIESDLQQMGATTLLFSLGKGLRSIPIATLWDGQQHLIEKYNYSIIPTTSLVDMKYSSLKETDVLAMGASEFQDKAALPAVPTELSTITTLWPGQSFLNESFTLDNLRNQRQQKNYEVIHLATHADFQPGTSNDSYIQLWDGRLPISQLPGLNWDTPPVELLVLSACRTAVGDQNAELGFAGLAIQAGVKSAIASLWHVNDESTLALMSQFYNDLHKSSIKAGALRKAQLAMLQGKVRLESGQLHTEYGTVPLPPEFEGVTSADFSHPYYWSGFAMIGAPW